MGGAGPGDTLIIKGDCAYDKYERDYVIYPYDVLKVARKKRVDPAPEKRVELASAYENEQHGWFL
ncbi:MAG: hypothetical protein ACLRZH_16365 [Ruthenibacterium lactatiformans]